jgi:hypothetical protein
VFLLETRNRVGTGRTAAAGLLDVAASPVIVDRTPGMGVDPQALVANGPAHGRPVVKHCLSPLSEGKPERPARCPHANIASRRNHHAMDTPPDLGELDHRTPNDPAAGKRDRLARGTEFPHQSGPIARQHGRRRTSG